MKKFLMCLTLTFACIGASAAEEIIITPTLQVGDTLRYRTSSETIIFHGIDTLYTKIDLLPTVIVEQKNDKGFVIVINNSLEEFDVQCTDSPCGNLQPTLMKLMI